ncbi:MAG: fluoride efflux transporter CrcB [Paracoccaceae bacterium]
MDKILMVGLGGGIGAAGRYLAAAWFGRLAGAGFMGTMFVNVVGSFLMGVLAVILMERAGAWSRFAPLLITGVLGGFTTFSAFSLDALYLIERGRMGMAAFYIMGSAALSIAALFAGLLLARTYAS